MKDWKKLGYNIEAADPLPEYQNEFIEAESLLEKIKQADSSNCVGHNNEPLLTIIDYRTEHFLKTNTPIESIKTKCKTIRLLLDDLKNPALRSRIPRKGPVVSVCETGNRDWAFARYLYKWGYTNIVGLRFGMRAWIKLDYPVESLK